MNANDEHNGAPRDLLTLHDLACVTGLSERILQRLVILEVIEPARRTPEPCFRVELVSEVRRMRSLHIELGVSWSSMPLVIELLDRIREMETQGDETSSGGID